MEDNMAKIFVRERTLINEGNTEPRFAIVGTEGQDVKLRFYKTHLRRDELETIAQSVGAEIVWLPRHDSDEKGQRITGRKHHMHRHAHSRGDVEAA